jgi:hypothetical protein
MKIAAAGMALALVMVAGPALAQADAPARDPDEVICKHEKKVNSRFTTKTCLTRGQWEAIAEANKRDFAENQGRHKIYVPRER